MAQLSYRHHRFPAEIIQHAIWLYLRFTLRACECLLQRTWRGGTGVSGRCSTMAWLARRSHWSDPIGPISETKQSMVEQAAMSAIELAPRSSISVCRGQGRPPQGEAAQHVVGECEPQQHGAGLVFAAHIKPSEAHAARPGIGAFGLRALPVELFASLACHAPVPI